MPRGRRRGGQLEREQRLIRPVARGMPEGIHGKKIIGLRIKKIK
jgi:hypothetical protein